MSYVMWRDANPCNMDDVAGVEPSLFIVVLHCRFIQAMIFPVGPGRQEYQVSLLPISFRLLCRGISPSRLCVGTLVPSAFNPRDKTVPSSAYYDGMVPRPEPCIHKPWRYRTASTRNHGGVDLASSSNGCKVCSAWTTHKPRKSARDHESQVLSSSSSSASISFVCNHRSDRPLMAPTEEAPRYIGQFTKQRRVANPREEKITESRGPQSPRRAMPFDDSMVYREMNKKMFSS